jgi:hypothetical protein
MGFGYLISSVLGSYPVRRSGFDALLYMVDEVLDAIDDSASKG